MNSCCPKNPAFLLALLFAAGCTDSVDPPANESGGLCDSDLTGIRAIQGEGPSSPVEGSELTLKGVATHIGDKGFYLEDAAVPADPSGSRALFVADQELAASVRAGQWLAVSGRVAELGDREDTLTALTGVSDHQVCSEQADLPVTYAELPLGPDGRESLEAMRVSFRQALVLSDHYNLHRGEMTLSSNGVPRVPTEVRLPGPQAMQLQQENQENAIAGRLAPHSGPWPVGTVLAPVVGAMGHDGRRQRLFLESAPEGSSAVPQPVPQAAEGAVRIVNANLLNFWNGDGRGGGFPGERGAESLQQFEAQKARTRAAMAQIQPDLLAVQELENDGFGPHSAASDLLALLNETGHDDWAFIDPGNGAIGGDVIAVGLFYRSGVLEAVGPARVLDGPEFQRLSRQPLAQRFRERRSGAQFLAVTNHLKSKGRCPGDGENSDRQDGQGCWNRARVDAVVAQLPAWGEIAASSGSDHVIILGDMNAWRLEDPIRTFTDAGYVDLVESLSGLPQHSFLYWGQTGTLDYAFASPSLAAHAVRALNWHVNAAYPQKMEMPMPWMRFSDHDPVIVDFDFSQSATSD